MRSPLSRFLSLLVLTSVALLAQGDRGAITGLITDKSGAAVPNVAVEAVNSATLTRFETVSTGTGAFRLVGLPIGFYDVSAKASG
ncbi:MAG: carboxypeptidase-like regulatory domain-containing protein, partial [Acidobacteriota bacterium]